jgi:hypothetical protein
MCNYVPNIGHLPGIIEIDVLHYFKMLCRRLERMADNAEKHEGGGNSIYSEIMFVKIETFTNEQGSNISVFNVLYYQDCITIVKICSQRISYEVCKFITHVITSVRGVELYTNAEVINV